MQREFSAGGAVLRYMQGQWWLAVIEPEESRAEPVKTSNPELQKKSFRRHVRRQLLALPKGLVDSGEKPDHAATREVLEETGVEATLVTKLKDIKYFYVRSWGDGQRVFKVVSFFLLLYRAGQLNDITPEMRREVKEARWLPLDEASKKLTYKGEREVAEAALAYLNAHPEIAATHATDTSR